MAIDMTVSIDIKNWITQISTPTDKLNGLSVCPYAKGTEYELMETDGSNINPPPWDFELIIYVLPAHYTQEELTSIATEYNALFKDLVFLPDHKDRKTFINNVQTSNGHHNLLLCQWRDNLEKARSKLLNTAYYSFWDQTYLDEILST
jgi:hypothetical protein